MQQFFAGRSIQLHGEQRQGLVDTNYFKLGFVLDWLGPHRSDLRVRTEVFQSKLASSLVRFRRAYEKKPRGFEVVLPEPTWDGARPANFAWIGLVRRLVLEAKQFQFKSGDALDLCHAVAGASFADFATLDRQWKRRVNSLPTPNGLAKVYYEPELDQLVEDVETALRH